MPEENGDKIRITHADIGDAERQVDRPQSWGGISPESTSSVVLTRRRWIGMGVGILLIVGLLMVGLLKVRSGPGYDEAITRVIQQDHAISQTMRQNMPDEPTTNADLDAAAATILQYVIGRVKTGHRGGVLEPASALLPLLELELRVKNSDLSDVHE